MTRKKIEQMWPTCPSIVQQDVSYTMHKQFGIDFAIGKNNAIDKAKAANQEKNGQASSRQGTERSDAASSQMGATGKVNTLADGSPSKAAAEGGVNLGKIKSMQSQV